MFVQDVFPFRFLPLAVFFFLKCNLELNSHRGDPKFSLASSARSNYRVCIFFKSGGRNNDKYAFTNTEIPAFCH